MTEDNWKITKLYGSSPFLQEHFRKYLVLNRTVLYGVIEEHLLIIKYKKNQLRIGFPSTFLTDDQHFDLCIDLSDFPEEKNIPDTLGYENHYCYILADLEVNTIEFYISELLYLKNETDKEKKKDKFRSINDFNEYLILINKLGFKLI